MSAAEYIESRSQRGLSGRVTSQDLRDDYERWCTTFRAEPLSRKAFCAELRDLGWVEANTNTGRGWMPPEPANDNATAEVVPIRADADDVILAYGRFEVPGKGHRGFAIPVSRKDVERLGDVAAPEILSIVVGRIERALWRGEK
jgi:hypothetical protein